MHFTNAITVIAAAAVLTACTPREPAQEPVREDAAAAETAAIERKRNEEIERTEKRVTDLERRWSEMEAKVVAKSAAPTAALRAEVKEDVKNVRDAVADLKTTTAENWWERHERAMERTANDIEEDVRRFAKGKPAAASAREPETPVSAAPFESRRDRFVAQLSARVDGLTEQLKDVRARAAQQTELEDTRARIEKLKDDAERLRKASADDWWDISSKRVSEYVDRLEESIRRLDDDTKPQPATR
jgi:DNA repair exonuclease SbcCD ATPase subunit